MKRLLKNLATAARSLAPRAPGRPRHSARPGVERLEPRLAPAVTDMTQLAKLFAPHAGPTHLYLDFDGYAAKGVSPFTGTSRDKEEIVFLTSEIFAPFNVEVSARFGDGNFGSTADGHTTVFVGDNTGFKDANGNNITGGVTPASSTDYPGQLRGDTHRFNGDDYDIAYVDPVALQLPSQQVTVVKSNAGIAENIAHEAGHTFGLAHVLGGNVNDTMSYNSNDSYFAAQTLPVTTLNNNPQLGMAVPDPVLQPSWMGSNIVTQNSYTTLQAALGQHPSDKKFHVVHTDSVDPSVYQDFPIVSTPLVKKATDTVQRTGEYDVYYVKAAKTGTVTVRVTGGPLGLVPVLLAYDSGGKLLTNGVAEPAGIPVGKPVHLQATYSLTANQSYYFVVGGLMGVSTGAYTLSLIGTTKPAPIPPTAVGSAKGAAAGAVKLPGSVGLVTPTPAAATTFMPSYVAAAAAPTVVGTSAGGAGRGAAPVADAPPGLAWGAALTTQKVTSGLGDAGAIDLVLTADPE